MKQLRSSIGTYFLCVLRNADKSHWLGRQGIIYYLINTWNLLEQSRRLTQWILEQCSTCLEQINKLRWTC